MFTLFFVPDSDPDRLHDSESLLFPCFRSLSFVNVTKPEVGEELDVQI